MSTYQVLVEVNDNGKRWTCLHLFEDLTEAALRVKFLEPYLAGARIPMPNGGRLAKPAITKLWILRTEDGYKEALAQERRRRYDAEEAFMRQSNMALPPDQSGSLDVLPFGKDVTREFVP